MTDETLDQATMMSVGPISLPVLSATQLMVHKLLTYDQHYCDFAPGVQMARSLREKINWLQVRSDTLGSPYAAAFLLLVARLGLAPETVLDSDLD